MIAILGCQLDMSRMNYNPEMEGTPVKDFLHGLKWVNPLLVQTFGVGRNTSNQDLEAGRHGPLIQILR